MKCHLCKHVGNVPGSAHRSCRHPLNKDFLSDPFMGMMAIFASVGRTKPQIAESALELGIVIHETGLRKGWANWPWDFDPVWIENCKGFEEKESKND